MFSGALEILIRVWFWCEDGGGFRLRIGDVVSVL